MKIKLITFAVAILSLATFGLIQLQARALDTTRDCDEFAVIRCGTMSATEAHEKYNEGAKIFSAMGINRGEITGDFKDGVVHKNGNVTVGGKVVATNARTAIRNMTGGNQIAGTNAAIYPTSRMGDDQTALVKLDANGKFLFAIMKPCGNPVKATPVEQPKPEPTPIASCDALTATQSNNTTIQLKTDASADKGAKIVSYTYVISKDGTQVDTKTIPSTAETNTFTYTQPTPGTYAVKVVVKTSEGKETSKDCTAVFTVKDTSKPAITLTKHVNGLKHTQVKMNELFTYRLVVTNTGNVDLTNVLISDGAPEGVQFASVTTGYGTIIDGTKWQYTIPTIKVGQAVTIDIQAKVVKEVTSPIKNTACIHSSQVSPNTPVTTATACDDATIEIPKIVIKEVTVDVCDAKTNTIITVKESEAKNYEPKNSDKCTKILVCITATGETKTIFKSELDVTKHSTDTKNCKPPVTPENPKAAPTPVELPKTGPAEAAMQAIGATSLAGATGYYLTTRRRG